MVFVFGVIKLLVLLGYIFSIKKKNCNLINYFFLNKEIKNLFVCLYV